MAFSYTGGAQASGNSDSPSVTHGLTINSGDLVVVYLNINGTHTITPDETYTGTNEETPTSETAKQWMGWFIAGSSEPSSYGFTLGSSDYWRLIVRVYPSATDAEVDAAFNTSITVSNTFDLACDAQSGQTLSDNCLSVIGAGKDNRTGGETYDTADNSYVSVLGGSQYQAAAVTHRIYGVSPSAPSLVTVDVTDGADGMNDKTYSTHISFVESSGGTTYNQSVAGSITGAGALTKKTSVGFDGSIGPSGTLSTLIVFTLLIAGSITATSAMTRKISKNIAGSITATSALTRKISKILVGNITSSGSVFKRISTTKVGSIAISGVLTTLYITKQAVSGTITAVGTVAGVITSTVITVFKRLGVKLGLF